MTTLTQIAVPGGVPRTLQRPRLVQRIIPWLRTANLAIPIGLIACLICLPLLRYVHWLGDEGVWFDAVDRLRSGEQLYLDIFEFLPPGSFLVVEGWSWLAGSSFPAMRILAMLTVAGTASLAYLCCREASGNSLLAAGAVLTWLLAAPPTWLVAVNHHWMTTLLSVAAILMALRGCRPGAGAGPPLLSGLAGGAAAMVTPVQGALVLIAAAAAFIGPCSASTPRAKWQPLAQLALGCAVVPLLLLGQVMWQGAFTAAFADVIIYTATRYASIQAVPFGTGGDWFHPMVLLPVVNVLLLAGVCIQDWRGCLRDRVLRTSAAAALAGFIAAHPRPDLVYLAYTMPLALPLTTCCIARLARIASQTTILACTACTCVITIAAARPLIEIQAAIPAAVQTATTRGAVAFREDGAAAVVTRLAAEPEGERVFFYPYVPMLPYLTGRQQVSKYDVFTPFYTTDQQYAEACADVLREAPLALVDWRYADLDRLRTIYPAMPVGPTAAKDALEAMLRSKFTSIWRHGSFELLRRTGMDAAAEHPCPGST